MALQPKESLEVIYEWVGDWDQMWAGIYLWWKYIDENKISILKVCDANLCDMTKETAMQQNKVILVVIAIADLHQPEGQQRFHIDDVCEDYLEWVKERVHLEAERLAKALATPMPGPLFKASSPLINEPQVSLPINKLPIETKPFFATATGLLNEPGDIKVPVQGDAPSVAETLEVESQCEWLTAHFIKCLQVLKARAKDEEFELEQVYQLLEMLARQVTHQIKTVWARWEELQRLKDDLWDL
ncbi:hypothetical protein M404DRAFT_28598 [Pisolithus tinctorius Marx 270]|uniref:Uncharacterized protein n=1 Tax=Pisolithus tinctorius Marx 270 TaxID=870435 RepID=A0A0C3JVU9_PISTI|nr:hypothetical protein M404DRAFT_28598 [Pisolithus tinctorius Marx 270]